MQLLLKIIFFVFLFFLIFTLFSCEDEETSPHLNNEILLFDNVKSINNVSIVGYGETSLFEVHGPVDSVATHWYYDVYLSESDDLQSAYSLSFSFYSVGTDTLHHGDYKFQESSSSYYLYENKDESLFTAFLHYDANNNGQLDVDGDDFFWINDGTVTTAGSGDNFTIDFNLKLFEGEYLEGSYSGEFSYE